MMWQGRPLLFEDNTWNREALFVPSNKSKHSFRRQSLDLGTTRFVVEPGFATLDAYPYASKLRLGWFSPLSNWLLQRGVPLVNGTLAAEEQTVTLKPGTTTGVITQLATIPVMSTMCRFRIEYYFNATRFDYTTSDFIGRVSIVARTASSDITTLKTFSLYAQGRSVVVSGGPKLNSVNGDVFSWERLGTDFVVMPEYDNVRVEVEVYHGTQRFLLFGNPYFQCSNSAKTPAAEVTALQRIWTTVGSASNRLDRWRNPLTSNFNGDPCVNQWRGVLCRHNRVVELDLSSSVLVGQFPAIPELTELRTLDIRNNSLSGTLYVNNTKLVKLYASRNRLTSVAPTAFAASKNKCLKVLDLGVNQLTRFPMQVIGHPTLEQLDLSFNRVAGRLPDFPATSPLVSLRLSNNDLAFKLPTLPEYTLITADFSGNRFTGVIPQQWGNLQNAEFVDVSKNRLNGTVPLELAKIASGGRLTFRAFENFLRGVLPNLPFNRVDLRYNAFSCPLPLEQPFIRTRHVAGLDDMVCDNF